MRLKSFQLIIAASFAFCAAASAADVPGTGADAGKTVIYRDTWGVPHIYAPTEEAGMYAMGWAQAQDRPEDLLKNLMRGAGELASVDGKGEIDNDRMVALWNIYEKSKAHVETMDPKFRGLMQAYADGVNAYYKAHPEVVPSWWAGRQADVAMVLAFGRVFLQGWSFDDGIEDLKRGGVEPGTYKMERASNEWAVAPSRTEKKVPILYIDPHLGFLGVSRFWEFRIHAGELVGSGFSLPGQPYIALGHNANTGWAMTTGGPDTADCYVETLKEDYPTKYLYDGEWKSFTQRTVTIKVKDDDAVELPIYESIHGPILAIADGKAYAIKSAYHDAEEGSEAWYMFNVAKDYSGVKAGMATLQIFPQNVMVADTSGNIYYQRTGRIPKRREDLDWSKPIDGSTSKNEWLGLHPADDHMQVLNPPQGYMQCCNVPPDVIMMDSPLKMDPKRPWLFADLGANPQRGGWSNPRAARAVELLAADDSVTIKEALAYAVDTTLYDADRWVQALAMADKKAGADARKDSDVAAALDEVLKWDNKLDADSKGALKYYYWRKNLRKDQGNEVNEKFRDRINNFVGSIGVPDPTIELSDDEAKTLVTAFVNGVADLKATLGTMDKTYGDYFRVGRGDVSWPVGGGGDGELDMSTLRNVKHHGEREDKTRWGRAGQTSTQIVVFTKPIQSWTFVPHGQSDDPKSPHFTDQAEKLFSPAVMKETWWMPKELAGHVESREELAVGK